MKILKMEPGERAAVLEINEGLEAMQAVVDGRIEAVYPFADPVALVCNEEGKLLGLPYNRALRNEETGEIYDIVCGTCFLCGAPPDCDTFTSLTEEQLQRYLAYFEEPELFLHLDGMVIVMSGKGEWK